MVAHVVKGRDIMIRLAAHVTMGLSNISRTSGLFCFQDPVGGGGRLGGIFGGGTEIASHAVARLGVCVITLPVVLI